MSWIGLVGWFQSATMSSTSVLCLFIDSTKNPISTAFSVNVGDFVRNLKDNTLHKNPQGVSPSELRVWRCKDRNTFFNDSDPTVLEDQITEIFESQQVELLGSQQAAADLQFSEQECILLEILGMLYAIALYMILKQLTLHRYTKEVQVWTQYVVACDYVTLSLTIG